MRSLIAEVLLRLHGANCISEHTAARHDDKLTRAQLPDCPHESCRRIRLCEAAADFQHDWPHCMSVSHVQT
jgi:hypothetical protein